MRCNKEKAANIYIFHIKSLRRPILSESRPTKRLPARPIKAPAPINPVQKSLMLIYLAALERARSEEHTSELQSRFDLVCRLLLEKKKKTKNYQLTTVK